MKQLLIFDAYGTLLSTGRGSGAACEQILALQDKNIDPVAFYADWKALHRAHIDESIAHGFVTEEDIFTRDLAVLYQKYGIHRPHAEDVQHMLRSLYGRIAFPEVAEVIRALRKRYRVVIGSTSDTAPLLDNLRLNGLEFDAVYTSESLRAYKPAPAFYRAILTAEGCRAEDAVFIGDSPVDDIMGPKACGIATVLIDRKKNHSLSALPKEQIPDRIFPDLTLLTDEYSQL